MHKIILVGGGARSGKSRFALAYARALGESRLFVATAQAHDAEMADRIERHRRERGADFATREEPIDLAPLLGEQHDADVILVDCLTLWLSNLLVRDPDGNGIEAQVEAVLAALAPRRQHVILVTNEVGLGIVPESALGRRFRDLAGRTHQQLAACADEIYLAALGMVVRLLPDPVTCFRPGQTPASLASLDG